MRGPSPHPSRGWFLRGTSNLPGTCRGRTGNFEDWERKCCVLAVFREIKGKNGQIDCPEGLGARVCPRSGIEPVIPIAVNGVGGAALSAKAPAVVVS